MFLNAEAAAFLIWFVKFVVTCDLSVPKEVVHATLQRIRELPGVKFFVGAGSTDDPSGCTRHAAAMDEGAEPNSADIVKAMAEIADYGIDLVGSSEPMNR